MDRLISSLIVSLAITVIEEESTSIRCSAESMDLKGVFRARNNSKLALRVLDSLGA